MEKPTKAELLAVSAGHKKEGWKRLDIHRDDGLTYGDYDARFKLTIPRDASAMVMFRLEAKSDEVVLGLREIADMIEKKTRRSPRVRREGYR